MVHPHILHRSPYDLRDSSAQGPFLPRLRSFADEFLREAEDRLGEVLDGHTAFLAAGHGVGFGIGGIADDGLQHVTTRRCAPGANTPSSF